MGAQGTHISPKKMHFEDDFPFPKVGWYVSSLEGILKIDVTTIYRSIPHPENCWDHDVRVDSKDGHVTKNPKSLGNAAPIEDLISGKRWRLFAGSVMQVL